MSRITIVDYANGNAHSVLRALRAVGAEATHSSDRRDIEESDFLILPGVGHSGTAMASLASRGLIEPLRDAVFVRGVPVLGICLGMHLMVDYIEEGDCPGLGWVPGRAVSLTVEDRIRYKIPHIGWNSIRPSPDSALYSKRASDSNSFYFCHKYGVEGAEGADSLSVFSYESERIASFEQGHIFGVQFHPEKSQEPGQDLFRAFLSSGR